MSLVVTTVSPVIIQRHTSLPRNRITVNISDPLGRDDLFRRYEVTRIWSRLIGRNTAKSLSANFQSIVDNDFRLMLSDHLHQFGRLPIFAAFFVIGEIKPENIQLSVIGAKLLHLAVHILKISVEIPIIIRIIRIASHWMNAICHMRIIGMIPIKQRIIQAYFNPLISKSF